MLLSLDTEGQSSLQILFDKLKMFPSMSYTIIIFVIAIASSRGLQVPYYLPKGGSYLINNYWGPSQIEGKTLSHIKDKVNYIAAKIGNGKVISIKVNQSLERGGGNSQGYWLYRTLERREKNAIDCCCNIYRKLF